MLSQRAEKKVQNSILTVEPCRKTKTNNQQLLRNKLKLKLKYEVNLRFETQINVWVQTRKKWHRNWQAEFLVYFTVSSVTLKLSAGNANYFAKFCICNWLGSCTVDLWYSRHSSSLFVNPNLYCFEIIQITVKTRCMVSACMVLSGP